LHNAIVRHVGDCEDFSYGDFSFRLNFSLQSWQENLPTMSDYFWLREAQFERIKPYFPLSHGVPSVDDRRVVSGIIHVACDGGMLRRFMGRTRPCSRAGSRMGVFARIFSNLVADDEPPDCLMIDSTHLKAHRTAASLQKRGMFPCVSGARKVG
jgi:putative transposase